MNEPEDEASREQRRAFEHLARERWPRPEVEERIVSALRERGLIRAAGSRHPRGVRFAAVAAGLALLAAGFLLGRIARPPRSESAPLSPRFALFLLRGEERPTEGPEEAARVAEYRAWARGLAAAGRFVSGEKLEDRSERVGVPTDGRPFDRAAPEEIRGFFVISASNFEDALAVARACPHLRHGGRILVRPIAPV